MDEEKIIQKLDEHGKYFDRVFVKLDEHDKQFDRVFVKLDEHDKQFDRVFIKLIEHDDQLKEIRESMATKDDIRELKGIMESVITIAKKIQEDHVFAVEWLKRLQTQIDRQDEDIRQIKLQLKMA
ncbi:MAG: hypothetical protein EXS55_02985 [Candidatus Magasanikbacteria bacterium]|nr:hypothetical protein [Candidatus Magasanikbacteria bacterium]